MADSRNSYNHGSGHRRGGGRGANYQNQYVSQGGQQVGQGGEYYQGGRGRGRENEYVPRGRGSGGDRRYGGGRGANYQNQYISQGGQQIGRGGEYYQGGRGRGRENEYVARGRGNGRGEGATYENHSLQSRGGRGGGYYRGQGGARGRGRDDQSMPQQQQSPQQYHLSGVVEPTGRGAWTGRPWAPRSKFSPSSSTAQPQTVSTTQYQIQRASESSPDPQLDIQSPDSVQKSSSSQIASGNKLVPVRRPDKGTLAIERVRLLANHFRIRFNPAATIIHYNVDVELVSSEGNQLLKRLISKSDMRLIREKLRSDNPELFPLDMAAYDGDKNIFSAVELPTGEFRVDLPDGEDGNCRSYVFTIKEVNQLKLSKLKDYICGNISYIPRDILQGMDLVMKENPTKTRIAVGRRFYSKTYGTEDDLGNGVAACRGFQQSLRPTSECVSLCMDYSVLAFRKPISVLMFLEQNVKGFQGVNDVINLKEQVNTALQGLKVHVTHRNTKQKYTIAGLTEKSTLDLDFDLVDVEGKTSPKKIKIVNYFKEKYNKEILHKNIPCLDLGKPKRSNYVPMEFCVLVEGQIYPKENLEKQVANLLKTKSLAPPKERKNTILQMVRADDGPSGDVTKNFGIEVNEDMMTVEGRVLGAPVLKLRTQNGRLDRITVNREKCHWNLLRNSVVEGIQVERWALIDCSPRGGHSKLEAGAFIKKLMARSTNLGMHMEEPVWYHRANMGAFSSDDSIRSLLQNVVKQAGPLQIIVCVMGEKHDGYKYLKWVSETQIGVVTQCCLSGLANKANDQYLANLCLKINAKLGGSNVELNESLPHFMDEDCVMFIGADVNHPAPHNKTCPSIAAVVGTVNWPAANRYAARVQPQEHRKEHILNFGTMCRDLLDTFVRLNQKKPNKIVVFRDGLSEGQFDMALNGELLDLKRAICDDNYQPKITLVVAQKRHQTRLFLENVDDVVSTNVPPGTVVDTVIVHPFEFDFYLCSHYGSIGTSKATHYCVLWDENSFTSNELQKLIYHLCFTYSRCTKPVSLVPPVYYADHAAYRGRLYQEAVQSTEPSVSTSSPSDLFKLHQKLQDVMFFV